MITPNPIIGTGIHAIGGISASTCYMPYEKINSWSWGVFWLVQATFAWFIMPLVIGYFTIPDLFAVLSESPSSAFWSALLLGAAYGFGGLAFGLSIRSIGYSLTYTISIGISAVLGTIGPLLINGGLVHQFTKPGGGVVLVGMIISIIGVALCGKAGFMKEKDIALAAGEGKLHFNMRKGLALAVFAGALSAVWGISLELGQPISDVAANHGAGHFEGNAKLIASSMGCLITNLTWFTVATIRDKSIKQLFNIKGIGAKQYFVNFGLSALAGSLWYMQFFFYGLGHVKMGSFQFASWVLHMSMLIFFSYVIGVIMKEWRGVKRETYLSLILALTILVISFIIMSYGSYIGEEMAAGQ